MPAFLHALNEGFRRRVLGTGHQETLRSINNLGALYNLQGKYSEAEPLLSEAIQLRTQILGGRHSDTLVSMHGLARLYFDEGKYAEAEKLFDKVADLRRSVLGSDHPDTVNSVAALGEVQLRLQNYAGAEPVLRDALQFYGKSKAVNMQLYKSQSLLGSSLAGQRKYSEAERLLISSYESLIQQQSTISGLDRSTLDEAGQRIVQLYKDWGKLDKAAEWKQELQSANQVSRRISNAQSFVGNCSTGIRLNMG